MPARTVQVQDRNHGTGQRPTRQMTRVVLTDSAKQDRLDFWLYIATDYSRIENVTPYVRGMPQVSPKPTLEKITCERYCSSARFLAQSEISQRSSAAPMPTRAS